MVRAPCCEKMGLKKGPWTAEEDQILISYIRNHGHGNWRALPKLAGNYSFFFFVPSLLIKSLVEDDNLKYRKKHFFSYFCLFCNVYLGLLRCGKSCRLRWTNYLRPDIKRGNFTREEEDAIIALHQTLGNK